MSTPPGPGRRPPERPLAEQAIATVMELLGKVDPKYLRSAGMFLIEAQAGRGRGGGSGGMAGKLGDMLGGMSGGDLRGAVGELRRARRRRSPVPPPRTPAVPERPANVLVGVGTVPGRAEGAARVVAGPDLPPGLGGTDVLVCAAVPNAWATGLQGLGGIVFETGGASSAAMRACREHGVPAVRLAGATGRLTDGTALALDGATGRVTLAESA